MAEEGRRGLAIRCTEIALHREASLLEWPEGGEEPDGQEE